MVNGNDLAIYLEDSEPEGACGQQKPAENDYILSSPSFYKDILDNCREFIYRRCLAKDQFDYISPFFGELTGFSPSEYQYFKKEDFFNLIHPEDRPQIERARSICFSSTDSRITQTIEYRIRKKDGSYAWVRDRTTVVKDEEGISELVIGTARDITEEKAAKEAFKESAAQFSAFMENLPNCCVFIKREDSAEPIYANRCILELFGQRKEWLKRQPDDFVKAFEEKVSAADKKVLAGAVHESVEQLPDKHGQVRTYRSIKFPLYREGKPTLLGGIGIDITELVDAEHELREREAQYRSIFESSLDGLVVYDLKGVIVEANPAAHKIFGYGPGEMRGLPVRELVSPEHRELHDKRAHDHPVPPYQKPIEVSGIKKDGSGVFIEMKGAEFEYKGANHALGLFRDITEGKEVAKRLDASEAQYQGIFNAATDAFFVVDRNGKIIEVNSQACTLYGYTREELLALSGEKLVSSDCPKTLEQFLTEVQKGKEFKGESVEVRKDGSTFDAEISGTSFAFKGEEHVLAIVRDVTERKNLEKQLTQAQKMEAIGTLAGGIAHDFNNLLMAIQGHISLLQLQTNPGSPSQGHFDGIEEMIQRGSSLTQQFLAFARGGKYEVTPTDLNKLIAKTVELFGRTKKEILFHEKYQENLGAAEIDRVQIEQVLMNLLVNAWQAMPSGGSIYIETEKTVLKESEKKASGAHQGKYVKVSVTDTGVGIDEDTKQRIFEPFFTTKKMGKGTGLGLASTYGIIKNHGGFISVESEPGKGATFTLYLPASEKEVPREAEETARIVRGAETVLIVDDEEMVVEVGKGLLAALGYNVLTAGSGQEALEVLRQHQEEIDLVILDMIMPGMSGGEVYEEINTLNPHIKTLLSSGYSIDGEAAEILGRGCNGFLQKPFKPDQLSLKIREVLDGT